MCLPSWSNIPMRMHALNLICFGPAERAGQVEFHRLRRGAVGLWAEFHHNRHLFRPVHHAGIYYLY